VRQRGRFQRAGGQLGKHRRGRLRRVQVGLPAVEGQELEHGRHRDLLVAAAQRVVAQQGVH
jgi:hypothetical protein